MFTSEADGECHRCGGVYEIHGHAAFYADQWTCPDCADAFSPGFGDVIRGLDRVLHGVLLDMFTRRVLIKDLNQVTSALRKLANLFDDIANDRTHLRLNIKAVEGMAPDEDGQLIGVSIDREIVPLAHKETVK
ncbi:hypothetical protein [Nonomuraea guangzhouensis]|uniref:Uncharacterized protein n=1 Tax=Nonomuraea guangzhouensis TaxID=1291555 RepID=A0ABW4GZ92_9ACTN|nr:hypothetical protein [Nonomuraea guangzhouensis]